MLLTNPLYLHPSKCVCAETATAAPSAVWTRRAVISVPLFPLLVPPPASAGKPVIDKRFALDLPDGFVSSKRTSTTNTIFVAGNFPRAAVVSVTAWPLAALLEEDEAARALPGFAPDAPRFTASARSLSEIAEPDELAKLLIRARDRDASSGALSSVFLASSARDGSLAFTFETALPVQNPDELEKQQGVRSLTRRSTAVASFGSVAGPTGGREPAILTAWGSCLTKDWDLDLGQTLSKSVDSFVLLQ